MPNISPRLGLPYLLPAHGQKHVTHNMALQMLDILTQLNLASLEAETPPASPAIGEAHALGAVSERAWSGRAGQLAFWDGGSWQFVTLGDGWRATDTGSGRVLILQDGGWQDVLADLDNLDGVGIATMADDQNCLAVAAHHSAISQPRTGRNTTGPTFAAAPQKAETGCRLRSGSEPATAPSTGFAARKTPQSPYSTSVHPDVG